MTELRGALELARTEVVRLMGMFRQFQQNEQAMQASLSEKTAANENLRTTLTESRSVLTGLQAKLQARANELSELVQQLAASKGELSQQLAAARRKLKDSETLKLKLAQLLIAISRRGGLSALSPNAQVRRMLRPRGASERAGACVGWPQLILARGALGQGAAPTIAPD